MTRRQLVTIAVAIYATAAYVTFAVVTRAGDPIAAAVTR